MNRSGFLFLSTIERNFSMVMRLIKKFDNPSYVSPLGAESNAEMRFFEYPQYNNKNSTMVANKTASTGAARSTSN